MMFLNMAMLCFRKRPSGNTVCLTMIFLKYEFSHIIIQVYNNYRSQSDCAVQYHKYKISNYQQYQFSLENATNNLMSFSLL